IPFVEEDYRRTALDAESPFAETAGAIVPRLALREPEGRSWNAHGRIEKAAAASLANPAMAIIPPGRGLFRFRAHGAAEAAAGDWNVRRNHRWTLPSGSQRVDICLGSRQQRLRRARPLRKTVADLVPRNLLIDIHMFVWSPRCILRHRPILRIVERPDIDPDVGIPGVEICDRRPTIGAEASPGKLGGGVGLEFALRQREGGSREPDGRAEEAARVPAAHGAMTNVSLDWGLLRFVAHGAAEAAPRDRDVLVGS